MLREEQTALNTLANVLQKEWKSGLRNTVALGSSSEELVALASTTRPVAGLAIHESIFAALVESTLVSIPASIHADISVALVREQVDGDNQQGERSELSWCDVLFKKQIPSANGKDEVKTPSEHLQFR